MGPHGTAHLLVFASCSALHCILRFYRLFSRLLRVLSTDEARAHLFLRSLQEYDHVPSVRQGRKALCKQMEALFLSQWEQHAHVCENFSPHKIPAGNDCSGTRFCALSRH